MNLQSLLAVLQRHEGEECVALIGDGNLRDAPSAVIVGRLGKLLTGSEFPEEGGDVCFIMVPLGGDVGVGPIRNCFTLRPDLFDGAEYVSSGLLIRTGTGLVELRGGPVAVPAKDAL